MSNGRLTILDKKARLGEDKETGWYYVESEGVKVYSDSPMVISVGKRKHIKIV